MPKINIKVSIKNNEINTSYNTVAIIQNNTLKYKEQDNTTAIYDYSSNVLIRENDALRLKYRFSKEKSEGIINIKEFNKELEVKIKTIEIEKKEYDVKIKFEVENNIFLYQIEVIK